MIYICRSFLFFAFTVWHLFPHEDVRMWIIIFYFKQRRIMIAYLDLIIIENFIMNFLMLYTTGKILCRTLCRWKISVASIIGVLYTFSLYINLPTIIINVSKVFMAAISCLYCKWSNYRRKFSFWNCYFFSDC